MSHVAPRTATATVVGLAAGGALVPLNSTMIAVALRPIARSFHISTGRAGILILLYLIAMLIGQPVAGHVADRFGARRTARIALGGFAACSTVALFPVGFAGLVAARAGQAAFGATLSPSVQSMLRSVSAPADRGRVFGVMGSVQGVGAAGGPVVGGLLIWAFGWRAIFAVNLPIIAVVLLVLARLDVVGPSASPGPEARAAGPDAPGGLSTPGGLANPTFLAAFGAQALSTLAQYSLLLVAPIILDARGWPSSQVGLALSALTVGMIVTGPVGGRQGDLVGRRRPVLVGFAVAMAGLVLVTVPGRDISPGVLIVGLAVFGIGLGGATPGLLSSALESVPDVITGRAAGVLSTSRYVGSVVATTRLAVFVGDDAQGATTVLAIALGALVLSVVAASWLPGRQVSSTGDQPVTMVR